MSALSLEYPVSGAELKFNRYPEELQIKCVLDWRRARGTTEGFLIQYEDR
jgi:hypothetical protein